MTAATIEARISPRATGAKLATKAANRRLADMMRAAGLRPSGEAWQLAKQGVPLSQIASAATVNVPPSAPVADSHISIDLTGERAADWDTESLAEIAAGEYSPQVREWADRELARRGGYKGTGSTRASLLGMWREAVELQYLAAEQACNGVLLTRSAVAAGVSARSLFTGPARRAAAHASEELMWYWADHPRLTFAAWLGDSDARKSAAVTF